MGAKQRQPRTLRTLRGEGSSEVAVGHPLSRCGCVALMVAEGSLVGGSGSTLECSWNGRPCQRNTLLQAIRAQLTWCAAPCARRMVSPILSSLLHLTHRGHADPLLFETPEQLQETSRSDIITYGRFFATLIKLRVHLCGVESRLRSLRA